MSVAYLNKDKLFRARRVVASKTGVNIELVPEQDAEVLKEYEILGGAYIGAVEKVAEAVEKPVEKPKVGVKKTK